MPSPFVDYDMIRLGQKHALYNSHRRILRLVKSIFTYFMHFVNNTHCRSIAADPTPTLHLRAADIPTIIASSTNIPSSDSFFSRFLVWLIGKIIGSAVNE